MFTSILLIIFFNIFSSLSAVAVEDSPPVKAKRFYDVPDFFVPPPPFSEGIFLCIEKSFTLGICAIGALFFTLFLKFALPIYTGKLRFKSPDSGVNNV